MSSPFATYPVPERSFIPANPARQAAATPTRGAGAKRGRKPKGSGPAGGAESSRPVASSPPSASSPTQLQWPNVQTNATAGPSTSTTSTITFTVPTTPNPNESSPMMTSQPSTSDVANAAETTTQLSSETGGILALPGTVPHPPEPGADVVKVEAPVVVVPGAEEDVDGDDEMLPAMADDDYSAQLSFQSQSKDNLKYVSLYYTDIRTLNLLVFPSESSWTTSAQASTTDSRLIGDMRCQRQPCGRSVVSSQGSTHC